MRKYSIIIPIYNRPDELDELLDSLCKQTYKNFEVIVIEDGSKVKCDTIANKYLNKLDIKYFYKENEGQGFARNFGAEKSNAEFLIFFDSDVVVPEKYFETVDLFLNNSNAIDAFGGEDRASENFNDFQKALSFAMTSILTTGGIRNKNTNAGGNYQIRSYNCGLKSSLFKKLGGFNKTNMGEDMELNHRLEKWNVNKCLIPGAFVFHKRRGNLKDFFKQIFSFGRTRIQLQSMYNIPVKLVHLLPVFFTLFVLSIPLQYFIFKPLALLSGVIFCLYFLLIFIFASFKNNSVVVGLKSIPASFIQLFAYGLGFLKELIVK